MVDEYQDTNSIQADIVKWLAQGHHNVMVVGDDAQSIYSFRGANYKNMFDFPDFSLRQASSSWSRTTDQPSPF